MDRTRGHRQRRRRRDGERSSSPPPWLPWCLFRSFLVFPQHHSDHTHPVTLAAALLSLFTQNARSFQTKRKKFPNKRKDFPTHQESDVSQSITYASGKQRGSIRALAPVPPPPPLSISSCSAHFLPRSLFLIVATQPTADRPVQPSDPPPPATSFAAPRPV